MSFPKEDLRRRIYPLGFKVLAAVVTLCGHEEVMEWREKTQARVVRRKTVRKDAQYGCDRGSLTPDVYEVST